MCALCRGVGLTSGGLLKSLTTGHGAPFTQELLFFRGLGSRILRGEDELEKTAYRLGSGSQWLGEGNRAHLHRYTGRPARPQVKTHAGQWKQAWPSVEGRLTAPKGSPWAAWPI